MLQQAGQQPGEKGQKSEEDTGVEEPGEEGARDFKDISFFVVNNLMGL